MLRTFSLVKQCARYSGPWLQPKACYLRATGLGVGVHRTRFRSLSLFLSQPAALPIASALLDAAVPMVDLSSSLFAAGVSEPDASARRGVHDGGGMSPFLRAWAGPSKLAFARRLFAAEDESLCESTSRLVGAEMWKGVLGVSADASAGSSDCERMRGVPARVPQVMSCLTAAGPSSDGVGDGREGTYEKLFTPGDLGLSVGKVMSLAHACNQT